MLSKEKSMENFEIVKDYYNWNKDPRREAANGVSPDDQYTLAGRSYRAIPYGADVGLFTNRNATEADRLSAKFPSYEGDSIEGNAKKAFFDGRADMPSAWTQGMWANIYNSVLSSVGTPLKAGASNLALMVERPVATWAGAKLAGDAATIRRGHYMYRVGMVDTLQKAMSHMNQVFKRASTDPDSVSYIMRDDIVRKNEDTVTLLRSFADAKDSAVLSPNSSVPTPAFVINEFILCGYNRSL